MFTPSKYIAISQMEIQRLTYSMHSPQLTIELRRELRRDYRNLIGLLNALIRSAILIRSLLPTWFNFNPITDK